MPADVGDHVRRDVVVAKNVRAGFGVPVGEIEEERPIPADLPSLRRDQETVPGAPHESLQTLVNRHPHHRGTIVDGELVERRRAKLHRGALGAPGRAGA